MGYQAFPSEKFCLTEMKIFIGEHFCAVFQKKSGNEKLHGWEKGVSSFSVVIFLSYSAEFFSGGTIPCCVSEKFRYRKRIWIRGGGVSRFSVEKLLSQIAENFQFSQTNNLCCLSENFR